MLIKKNTTTSHYNYLQAIYKSFYSASLYVDIASRWRGFGLCYLTVIIALASLPLSLLIMMNFNQFFTKKIIYPFEQLPVLSVHHGQIAFEQTMPLLIKNPEGQVVSIIDTTGGVNGINETYPYLSVLITKNKMHYRLPDLKQFVGIDNSLVGNKVYTQSIGTDDNGIFDGTYWIKNSGISKINRLVQVFIYPTLLLFFLGLYLSFILIFSALGQSVADTFFGLKLQLKESYRLLTVACTPQIVFYFTVKTMQWPLPGLGFYSLILLISYFYYALYSVKQAIKAADTSNN
jgi:hypothetical protein